VVISKSNRNYPDTIGLPEDKMVSRNSFFKGIGESDIAGIGSLGITVVASVAIGFFLGLWIDRLLLVKPVFTVLLTIFGFIGSFYNIYRTLKKTDNNKDR
jgi:hypothetical protein